MTRKVSNQLMRHTHIHADSASLRMIGRSGTRVGMQPATAKGRVSTIAKSALGPWSDRRVMIAHPHVTDHLQIAAERQKSRLRSFATIPEARRRLSLEDGWASVNHEQARIRLADRTSRRVHHHEPASHKLDRGACYRSSLRRRSLLDVLNGVERAHIDRAEGQLGPPEDENDVQENTRRGNHRNGRSHANHDQRSEAIACQGIDIAWRRQSRPQVSPNRSATKIAYPSDKAPAWGTESRERGNVRIARTLELERGPAGGALIIGCLA